MSNSNQKLTSTLVALCVFTTGLFLISCKDETKTSKEETAVVGSNFKLNCVIIEKKQLQDWVDRGWTDPAKPDSLIKKILLQFYSVDGASANNNLQLMSFPAKNYLKVWASGKTESAIDKTCTTLVPSGKIMLANTYLTIKDLNIVDKTGNLTNFSFIRLRPVQDRAKFGDYITFKWEVVLTGADNTMTVLAEGDASDPCPTYCEEEEGVTE